MKHILISQEQFKKAVQKAMHSYTDKMRKSNGEDYGRLDEISDVLTMSVSFALLEYDLFCKEDKKDAER